MSAPLQGLADLRMADVLTFLAVRRAGSVSGAARELDVTPSQVSKAVRRLERQLRVPLFTRGARGVVVADSAQPMVEHLEAMAAHLEHLERPRPGRVREVAVAAPSY